MAPTTPTGSSRTVEFPIRSSKAYEAAISAKEEVTAIDPPTWTAFAKRSGAPSSAVTVSVNSPLRACSASRSAPISAARSAGGVAAQPGRAARAARTAASTSSAVPAGTSAMTWPSAGLTTSIRSAPTAGRHAPSMYIPSWAFMAFLPSTHLRVDPTSPTPYKLAPVVFIGQWWPRVR